MDQPITSFRETPPNIREIGAERDKNSEINSILSILDANKQKNFIQRILRPEMNPVFHAEGTPEGSHSTHLMSNAEVDGKNISYPNIIQLNDGSLKQLSGRDAVAHAMESGEYVQFPTPEEAEAFSTNYKKVWNK